jgi:AraC family transcriptional regulator, exoenzyme S synthesis regulatory protein ExsA
MEPQKANVDYNGVKFFQIFKKEEKMLRESTEHVAIVLVVDGAISITGKTGKHIIHAGGGYIMKQFSQHSVKRLDDASFDGIICFADTTTICRIIRSFDQSETLAKDHSIQDELAIPESQNLKCFIQSLKLYLPLASSGRDMRILSESKLYELFWLLKQACTYEELGAFMRSIYSREKVALDYMLEKVFRENISLQNLANMAGCSISTFKRKFEQLYQTTPGKWIQTRRLDEAYHLIHTTEKTISEICFEVGFENPSHFIQTFKSRFGITPKQLQYKLTAA